MGWPHHRGLWHSQGLHEGMQTNVPAVLMTPGMYGPAVCGLGQHFTDSTDNLRPLAWPGGAQG